jgi:hypothetical protein
MSDDLALDYERASYLFRKAEDPDDAACPGRRELEREKEE